MRRPDDGSAQAAEKAIDLRHEPVGVGKVERVGPQTRGQPGRHIGARMREADQERPIAGDMFEYRLAQFPDLDGRIRFTKAEKRPDLTQCCAAWMSGAKYRSAA